MCSQNIMHNKHIGKRVLPMRFVPKHVSSFNMFDAHIDFLSHFNFLHPRFKAQYFPQLKKHEIPVGEKGGIVGTMVFRLTTQWAQGLLRRLAHVVKSFGGVTKL